MRISWNWLRQYIDTDLTPQQAAEVLTSTGLETEGVELHEPVKGMLAGVLVGHVVQCDRHPDADRLSVCLVDLGTGAPVQIVCGAPNVSAGQKVLVATVGTIIHLPDGTSFTIKKSKIRGQESQGMICAEDELGLGKGHDGIMVLDPSATVGMPAVDHLGLRADHVLEIGLTPNRTDAMGHLGIARDLRAALVYRKGTAIELQWPSVDGYAQDVEGDPVQVEVRDAFACPRYAGVTLSGVRVGPSPGWMQERLLAIGLKPVNNVVDVTNYVQHELGQPLHAFDADRLEGGRIVVRKARAGEHFTTLDDKERKLDADDLVIADAVKPACIAGVFGGAHSGVSATTTRVFLESACFEAAGIRRTARRHALNTDASFRFERGVDPEITVFALKRAALLLKEVAGARISSTITDFDHTPKHRSEVGLKFADIERLAGLQIPVDQVVHILELLEFRIRERNTQGLQVQVPAYRVDVHRPADVVEEVLRIHGYDHVPLPTHLRMPPLLHETLTLESLRAQLGPHLASRGSREVMTPSLVSRERLVKGGSHTTAQLVTLANPLSAELDALRPTMLPGLLGALAYNINRQQRDLRFFERGRTYVKEGERIVERETMGLVITGRRQRENWRSDDARSDLYDLKEELEAMLERLGLSGSVQWEPLDHALLETACTVLLKGRPVGAIGSVRKPALKAADVNQPVVFAELDEQALLGACRAQAVGFTEVPRFPSVRRDLSLLLAQGVRFEQLRKLAFNAERKLLREVGLFDVYQGDKLPAGKKSYALSFVLQDAEKTLTDEQVDKAMGRIRQAFEKELGAELRG